MAELISDYTRIQRLEAALRGLVNHWHEFGPEHGLDETMDAAHRLLTAGHDSIFAHAPMDPPEGTACAGHAAWLNEKPGFRTPGVLVDHGADGATEAKPLPRERAKSVRMKFTYRCTRDCKIEADCDNSCRHPDAAGVLASDGGRQ